MKVEFFLVVYWFFEKKKINYNLINIISKEENGKVWL